jgi:integrase
VRNLAAVEQPETTHSSGDSRHHLILTIACQTGLRLNEILGIKLDPELNHYTVRSISGAPPSPVRMVLLPSKLLKLIYEYLDEVGQGKHS